MKSVILVLIVLGMLVCVVGGIFVGVYNGIVTSGNAVENKWADVQSAYQRRLDLVNQTLPAVIGGAAQELAVFKTLRDQAAGLASAFNGNSGIPTGAEAEELTAKTAAFDQAWINAMSYVADNPEIKSNELFSDFMIQVEGSENRINVARKDYNLLVSEYRNKVMTFPGSTIASIFNFDKDKYPFFKASEAAQDAPTVTFPTLQP